MKFSYILGLKFILQIYNLFVNLECLYMFFIYSCRKIFNMNFNVFGNKNAPTLMLIPGLGVSYEIFIPLINFLENDFHIINFLAPFRVPNKGNKAIKIYRAQG